MTAPRHHWLSDIREPLRLGCRAGLRGGVEDRRPCNPSHVAAVEPVAAGICPAAPLSSAAAMVVAALRARAGAHTYSSQTPSERHETHGLAAAATEAQLEHVAGPDLAGLVHERRRVALPVGAIAVAVDLRAVAATGIEEGQGCLQYARGVVADRAEEPLLAAARLACQHRVLADRTVDHAAFLPVHSHVADELQRLRLLRVMLGQVGDHLHRAV